MTTTRDRIRPGWLMPEELERERMEARVTIGRMMRAHARYRARRWIKALPGRAAAASLALLQRAFRP